MRDTRTNDQKLIDLNDQIDKAVAHWHDIEKNGCSDPFWPDGLNMNLVRNHVIWYLTQIKELSVQPVQISLFGEPVGIVVTGDVLDDPRIPPEVDNDFMATDRKCFYFDKVR
ncbi:MAG: hypothetical protein IKH75_01000 [Ruminococcus sp.]|nr:hypothetical protein [Ruminococcus sp.]